MLNASNCGIIKNWCFVADLLNISKQESLMECFPVKIHVFVFSFSILKHNSVRSLESTSVYMLKKGTSAFLGYIIQ